MNSYSLNLDIYKVHIELTSEQSSIIEVIEKDFSYFVTKEVKKAFKKTIINVFKNNGFKIPKNLKATKQTNNSIYFDDQNLRYNDYYGKAITVFDFDKESVDVYYSDESFLHELIYLIILSRSAKHMDRQGLHKIHASAVKINRTNIVFMMPSKGGKSTMLLELLRDEKTKLISDDTPVVDRAGNIHPFPLRIGFDDKNKLFGYFPYLRDEKIYSFKREYFSEKNLISISDLRNKIGVSAKTVLIQGRRSTFKEPRLIKISKVKMFYYLITHMIVGIGLPLILEYFLQHTIKDHFINLKNLFSRTLSATTLVIKSDCYDLMLSDNFIKNAEKLKEAVSER
jgi:hypothetical protein